MQVRGKQKKKNKKRVASRWAGVSPNLRAYLSGASSALR